MSLCSPDDVKNYVKPVSVSDLEITNIITRATKSVLAKARSTDETNVDLIEAGIHEAAVMVIKLARSKGELASSVETPESKISITGIIEEIKQHEAERDYFIQSYKDSVYGSTYSSPSLHCGFDHHHGGC